MVLTPCWCQVEGSPVSPLGPLDAWGGGGSLLLLLRGKSSSGIHMIFMDTALEVKVLTPRLVGLLWHIPIGMTKGHFVPARWGCKSSLLLSSTDTIGVEGLIAIWEEGNSWFHIGPSLALPWWGCWGTLLSLTRLEVSAHTQPVLVMVEVEQQFFPCHLAGV